MSEDRSTLPEIIINFFSIAFIIAGIYIALPSTKVLYNIQTSRSWPQAAGLILSSAEERRWVSRGDGPWQEYRARIVFSYDVSDRHYVSDMVSFAKGWTMSRGSVQKAVAQYPAGKTAAVYYCPSDPQTAILDISLVPPIECLRLGLGVLFVLAGSVALVTTVLRGLFE